VHDVNGNELNGNVEFQFTTDKEFTRYSGIDRYETSIQISRNGWSSSDVVVLATGADFPDALSAAPLAKKYNAPILLSNPNQLTQATETEIDRLHAKEIYIIGGYGAISQDIENKLVSKGIKCTRIQGRDRYQTSLAIANYLGGASEIFVATGDNFPDALSIASYAANQEIPIILTKTDSLPTGVNEFIKDNGITKAYVIGGTGVISDNILNILPGAERIAGNNRYETNIAVFSKFQFNFSATLFATGENFPDALSGSALAGQGGFPIVLVSPNMPSGVISSLRANRDMMKMKYILGGEGVVPNNILDSIFNG
jgi:putative cell wall-binding protein